MLRKLTILRGKMTEQPEDLRFGMGGDFAKEERTE